MQLPEPGAARAFSSCGESHVQSRIPRRHACRGTHRAAVALEHTDPKRAIDLLKPAERFDLGGGAGLYQIYLRGDAYIASRDGKAAAAEFQKFVDHRGQVGSDPLGALARLGLARADVLQGNSAKAKAEYQDFLTLWKDADPDIPILQQAKREYSKLQ